MNYEPGFLVDFIDTFLEQQEVDVIVLDGQVSWMIKPECQNDIMYVG